MLFRNLTHYHTMPHCDALKIYGRGKHCEKRTNCSQQAISLVLAMFSNLNGIYFSFWMHFKVSSTICFDLDLSKILSFGNGLKQVISELSQNAHFFTIKTFKHFQTGGFLKTLWKNKEVLVISTVFSNNIVLTYERYNAFNLGQTKILSSDKSCV